MKELVEQFITYFKQNKFSSYEDFSLKTKYELKHILSLKRQLQRKFILTCNKTKDPKGYFISEKIFIIDDLNKIHSILKL